MAKRYIGIDPGKHGGIAIIEGDTVKVSPYSDAELLALGMLDHSSGQSICCLEKVSAMPKQGVTSMFNFGVSFGYIKGVLEAFGVPYQEIRPQTWKAEFSLNTDKTKSIEVCQRLFPDVCLLANERCRVPHDGMAEALLMALYAKRRLG